MTEQVENQAVEAVDDWVEVGADKSVEVEAEQEQSSEAEAVTDEESADVELVIDGQAVSPTADETDVEPPADAPHWVKQLRQNQRELARENAELKKQLQQVKPVEVEPEIKERPMPELTDPDIDFDTDKLKTALADWTKEQIALERQKATKEQSQQAEQQELDQAVQRYNNDKLKAAAREPDYQQAESAVVEALSIPAQAMIMQLADNAASIVLAAGRNKALLAELKALESNPIKLAKRIGELNKSVGFAPKVKQPFKPEPQARAATSKPQNAADARFSAAFPDAEFK